MNKRERIIKAAQELANRPVEVTPKKRKENGFCRASFRFQIILCKGSNHAETYESEWESDMAAAKSHALWWLQSNYKRGDTDLAAYIINIMNHKQEPLVVTMEEALAWAEEKDKQQKK